jgi:hypothetical protein
MILCLVHWTQEGVSIGLSYWRVSLNLLGTSGAECVWDDGFDVYFDYGCVDVMRYFFSRSDGTRFYTYRAADCCIYEDQISSEISKTKIFHTTCFALSKIPQENYFNKAQEAYDKGCKLSIDLMLELWKTRKSI